MNSGLLSPMHRQVKSRLRLSSMPSGRRMPRQPHPGVAARLSVLASGAQLSGRIELYPGAEVAISVM